jgi:hypothetical protein
MDDSTTLKNIENRLSALIALTALSAFGTSEERKEAKPEVILSQAGLANSDIAKILGKNLPAIQKALQRAKK